MTLELLSKLGYWLGPVNGTWDGVASLAAAT
jgi:hypothetical protein